jgi:ubiquinone/menaquinone biosynthesis C-methylase UbiE
MVKDYLFGDSDLAAQRLELLAEIFAGTTRVFIQEAAEAMAPAPRVAVDLGCGPGHTTRLLADALGCERVVGVDNSEHFLELANRTATERVAFLLHDVTKTPFPIEGIDLMFARFLLTHLDDPKGMVMDWITQLRPGGILLVEEPEDIQTRNASFRQYLDIVEAMMDEKGVYLYVGRSLDGLKRTDDLKQRSSAVRPLSPPTHRAAAMFYLNIQTWKNQPFVQQNYPAGAIDKLESELEALAARSTSEIEIQWGLRQIVFERV